MARGWTRDAVVLIWLLGLLAGMGPLGVRAQGTEDIAALRDHVSQLQSQGKYAEAVPIAERYVAVARERYGEERIEFATAIAWLAYVYQSQGRYAEAEPLLKRALAIREKAQGPDHPDVATRLNNLAVLYRAQGRYAEAEPLLKRALAISEKALGPDHPWVGTALNNLALLYNTQGRTSEAEPLHKRALAISEKALGPDHPSVGGALNNLAELYRTQGRAAEAEPLMRRALAIAEKALGPDHPIVGTRLNNLALLYEGQRRTSEAEPLYLRTVAIREKALGPEHPDVGNSLNNLATLYYAQGRYAEAEPLFKRALAISEKAQGPDHLDVSQSLNNLAVLAFAQRDWVQAANYWRRSTDVLVHRAQRGTADLGQALTGRRTSDAEQLSFRFWGLVKVAHRLAGQDRGMEARLAQEMFQTAQWAESSAASASLAQMAARGAKGDPDLATIVRDRQDLVAEWQKLDGVRTAAISQTPDKRDSTGEGANVAQLAAIDMRIASIDKRLLVEFPDYAALARPRPLSVEEVQAQLGAGEALMLFLDTPEWNPTPEETFIWVVTKTDVSWVKSDLGTPSLTREVAALRCGLDYDGTWGTPGSRCSELLRTSYTEIDHRVSRPLPFDAGRAHALYKALFGPVENLIRDKHLFIVPSGALTQLPFQVLVTDKPDPTQSGTADFRRAPWLVRSHALTVLPSVSSLKALRQLAKASHASRTLIGFGNPLLDGPNASYAKWASEARSKRSCPKAAEQRVAALTIKRRGVLPLNLRRGLVDVAEVRLQVPLPETADELCAVARNLGASADEIRLGERATETEIKRLSAAGELSKYQMVHFATHGALAGQIGDGAEPGLLLTPPVVATQTDDGYLSASEIAALKLDADWVILSACNTAAGGAEGAEALSGLARAFFYAGARALLVSHWAVYSEATVKLITGAMGRMAADKSVGRAQAMRDSMLAMIDKGQPFEAHPAYWAPFVVVGEGAAAK
jgi:CHAT domain-containing protein/tetratricopeptide (TPR) repeat protein